jgi:hypothetical protein
MAAMLAGAPRGAKHPEIVEAARQIGRYFTEGFALHVEDEEIDIAPRLPEGVGARLRDEHDTHRRGIAELVARCAELERHPERLEALADALGNTVGEVTLQVESHLRFEEAVMFPAIRALDPAQRDAIREAMRRRRAP